jgi:DNA-directed RNA polymerase specialized sigma subunit
LVGEIGGRNRSEEILRAVYFELGPEEKVVYEHTVGYGGKKPLTVTELAKKLGTSPSNIVRTKHKIAVKIKKYV